MLDRQMVVAIALGRKALGGDIHRCPQPAGADAHVVQLLRVAAEDRPGTMTHHLIEACLDDLADRGVVDGLTVQTLNALCFCQLGCRLYV